MEVDLLIMQILMAWIKRVAYQRRLPPNQIKDASVTILPYGSYGLGVSLCFHLLYLLYGVIT